MTRYLSLIDSGFEGLEFPDLLITNAEGYKRAVKVKRNEFIPQDKLDPKVIEKSLATGCLGNAIRAGWVVAIEEGQLPPVEIIKSDAERLEEFKQAEVKKQAEVTDNANKSQEQMASEYRRTNINTETLAPGVQIVNNAPSPKVEVVAPKIVSAYDEFNSLKHFAKISLIAKTTDKGLLQTIIDKSDSKQLKQNATKQLKSLT